MVSQLQGTLPGPHLFSPDPRKESVVWEEWPQVAAFAPALPFPGRAAQPRQARGGLPKRLWCPRGCQGSNIGRAVPRSSTGSSPTQGKRLSAASNHSEDSHVSGSTLSASGSPEEGREAQQPEGAAAEAPLEGGRKLVAEEKGQVPPEEVATLEETAEDQEEELELEYSEVGAGRPPKAAHPRAPHPGRSARCA